MKTLKFEGAGWSKAENNGVGNCRIRSTFINDKGMTIYLEMIGHATSMHSAPSQRNFIFPWYISHLHKVDINTGRRDESRHAPSFGDTWKMTKEYTKKNILNLVNLHLDCSFDEIEVNNENWNGFSVDGKE